MTSCPTDLSPPEARVSPATEPAGLAGEMELNAMIWLAREIVAGRRVRARVPAETLVMSLAQTVCKLAEDRG